MRPVEIDGEEIALFRFGSDVFATSNVCTHAYAMLTDGTLDGEVVECPLHGGRFDARTGKGQGIPIMCDLETFQVRIVDGTIEVRVPG
jgi:naphthalene 1,2-dioxygenase system ferredoxin subunit